MANDSNASIIRRFVDELWNRRNLEVADEIFADNCVTHQLQSGSPPTSAPRDPETIKQHVREWLQAFPDLTFGVEQMVVAEDRVASHITMQGTHIGTWMGVAPTGRRISIQMMTIHRIEAGKIVEDWVLVDSLGLFQQLGLVAEREKLFAQAR